MQSSFKTEFNSSTATDFDVESVFRRGKLTSNWISVCSLHRHLDFCRFDDLQTIGKMNINKYLWHGSNANGRQK